MRPLVRSTLISTFSRSPLLPGAIGTVFHAVASVMWPSGANARKSCARPPTISAKATYSRLLTGSNAGTGYDPGPRNGMPGTLKQYGGNRQTGFSNCANCTGALQVMPRSEDSLTYITDPLPP